MRAHLVSFESYRNNSLTCERKLLDSNHETYFENDLCYRVQTSELLRL